MVNDLERYILLRSSLASGGCWIWNIGKNTYGYGVAHLKGKNLMAHRLAYEIYRGKIPIGKQIDHLCRNRDCVNPHHMEVVTCRENILRGNGLCAKNAKKTHCKRGHAFFGNNVRRDKKGRYCHRCKLTLQNKRRRSK